MTAKPALAWNGVTARRMERHALAEPATDLDLAGVAGLLCGAHAQVRRSGRRLALTVEPLHELTAAQLRQLDDEAGLVGTVMEAPVTLTVGPVTAGAHA